MTSGAGFQLQIGIWLWFTVLFATYAEAVAEARGRAQAATLRRTRSETTAHRRRADGTLEAVGSSELRKGDVIVVEEGEIIPGDGDVIEGVGLRQRGGDHRRVGAGAQGAGHGHPQLGHRRHHARQRPPRDPRHDRPGRDLPRPDDRPRRGREAAADAERDRARDPARGPDDRVPHGDGHPAAVRRLRGDDRRDGRAHRAARVPHPDHHRRPAVRDRHRRHGPRRAVQRAGHERPGGRGVRGRRRHPARQDRHHHLRQPARGVDHRRRPASPRRTPSGRRWWPRSATRRPRAARSSTSPGSGSPSSASPAGTGDDAAFAALGATIAEEIPFRAETRSSGVRLAGGETILKGAVDAIAASASGRPAGGARRRGRSRSPTPAATPLAIRGGGRCPRHDRAQGHGQGGPRRAVRRVPQDGHPHRDDHGRQPAHRGHDREGGRRRRLHRAGHARGEDRVHPQGAGRRPPRRDDRRRHERRAGPRPVGRRAGDEQRHVGRQGGGQHGRPRLRPDEAARGHRDRQAAADHPRLDHDVLDRQRRREVLRDPAGAVRERLPGARCAQRHGPLDARRARSCRR